MLLNTSLRVATFFFVVSSFPNPLCERIQECLCSSRQVYHSSLLILLTVGVKEHSGQQGTFKIAGHIAPWLMPLCGAISRPQATVCPKVMSQHIHLEARTSAFSFKNPSSLSGSKAVVFEMFMKSSFCLAKLINLTYPFLQNACCHYLWIGIEFRGLNFQYHAEMNMRVYRSLWDTDLISCGYTSRSRIVGL
jgi:hypothetical protein